jgi:hypothetical protein
MEAISLIPDKWKGGGSGDTGQIFGLS